MLLQSYTKDSNEDKDIVKCGFVFDPTSVEKVRVFLHKNKGSGFIARYTWI